ncbi:hypothetical protein PQE70_gp233 [Bacillus phage vB_BanS_Nate]|uniref:Uncharacterized protein n=1 Tax=Bacillus phage vB_BanS_Nate TaxID=2894788 RepID=A0AAE8YW20_9CAUD|nr:hypothetical protein PQE70_gp233 [Bacillus phage vB_BanS_Nate]UGO51086.1 hypothetical protein NATE_233 [Bacillus phage vB_BanS_Nate]
MMMKSTNEMLDYLKVLTELNNGKFRCEKEIMDVVGLLHGTGFGFADGKAMREKRFNEIKKQLSEQTKLSRPTVGTAPNIHGQLIRVTEKERQIGKTTLLIDLALFYDIPILVGNESLVEYTKELAFKKVGWDEAKKIVVLVGKAQNIMGRRIPNGVLIDCSVKFEEYKQIKKYKLIRGGFHHDKEFI